MDTSQPCGRVDLLRDLRGKGLGNGPDQWILHIYPLMTYWHVAIDQSRRLKGICACGGVLIVALLYTAGILTSCDPVNIPLLPIRKCSAARPHLRLIVGLTPCGYGYCTSGRRGICTLRLWSWKMDPTFKKSKSDRILSAVCVPGTTFKQR